MYQTALKQLAELKAAREKARDIWYAWINQADRAEIGQYQNLCQAVYGKRVRNNAPAEIVLACSEHPSLAQQMPHTLRKMLQGASLLPA